MAILVLIMALLRCFTCDVLLVMSTRNGCSIILYMVLCERSLNYKNNCEKQVKVSCDGLLVMATRNTCSIMLYELSCERP